MKTKTLTVSSERHTEMIDISADIRAAVAESGVKNGICLVFVPHTTAAVTVNENADPDVKSDIIKELAEIVPWEDNYRHREGNAAAHLKSSLVGCARSLIIEDGDLLLGTWQGVYFCEYDGPRRRKVLLKIIADA